jgi:NAD-dependent SIR2 family protein deacetylase
MASALPNAAHLALAQLEHAGVVTGIITQNVVGLHHAARSRRVIELHGALADVVCLTCDTRETRADYQARLLDANPGWTGGESAAQPAPDGDMEIPDTALESFVIPECVACGGVIKPDVVFFGENVPRPRVDRCFQAVEEAAALLVLGSSLTVLSGFRFVRHAARRATPIAIVNQGATRGDDLATVRVDGALGEVLSALAD